MSGSVTCPRCEGRGYTEHTGFLHTTSGCRVGTVRLPCALCDSTGTEIPERREWAERGARLRADRLTRNMSLSHEAKRRGLKVTELSDMEMGRIEPRSADAPL